MKRIGLNFLLKLSNLKPDFTLTLGYLNPALNNPALNFRSFQTLRADKKFEMTMILLRHYSSGLVVNFHQPTTMKQKLKEKNKLEAGKFVYVHSPEVLFILTVTLKPGLMVLSILTSFLIPTFTDEP